MARLVYLVTRELTANQELQDLREHLETPDKVA